MTCRDGEPMAEFEYSAQLLHRRAGECLGPLATLQFTSMFLGQLEHTWDGYDDAVPTLWGGHVPDGSGLLTFRLCVTHWFDLAYVTVLNSREHSRPEGLILAVALFRRTLAAVGWDYRELANRLTPLPL